MGSANSATPRRLTFEGRNLAPTCPTPAPRRHTGGGTPYPHKLEIGAATVNTIVSAEETAPFSLILSFAR